MTLEVYRIHSSRYPANSGEGAAIHGGRWNKQNVRAIYASQSRSLAALEVLAHYAVLPLNFVLTPIRIPEDRVSVRKQDPFGLSSLEETQHLGEVWFFEVAVFSVPSVIIPQERNYVLNPAHREFQHIEFGEPEPFQFDPRLKATLEL